MAETIFHIIHFLPFPFITSHVLKWKNKQTNY
jgi:hypothetical protein